MVRRLSELHGGSVSVTSAGKGRGSEFTVVFPAIAAPKQTTSSARAFAAGVPRSVVIVEDNADVRAGLRQILELAGHSVIEAADGKAGVDAIVGVRPDVAFVDIGLPILDGYGVAREVRSRPDMRSTLLVAVSGYGAAEDRKAGVEAGFDAYVVKPIDEAKLREILDRLGSSKPASNVIPFN
jgi:CheY-like chemotaxis protein